MLNPDRSKAAGASSTADASQTRVSPRAPGRRGAGVTFRAVAIGTILIPPNAYWLVQMDMVRYSAHATTVSIFFNVIFLLLVLTLLNRLVYRFRPTWSLGQGELIVVYVMLSIASAICAPDSVESLVPILTWPYHHADATNKWASLFFKYLPRWLMVPDENATKAFYLGNSTLYTTAHLRAWILPAILWTVFISLLLWVMLCLNVILRKQWTDNERLAYPIVQLPFEMTEQAGRSSALFRNRLFWIGFGLSAGSDLVNALNLYYPSVPPLLVPGFGQSFLDLSKFFTNRPLNAIGWSPIEWYPFLVGLGMLLPLDFLFSAWFFYLFWKAEAVLTVALGWDKDPRFPYIQEQSFGAYLAFLVFTAVLARGYFKQVILCALGRPSTLDDSGEPMRYRWAIAGMIAGTTGLVAFSRVMGMSIGMALAFFAIFFGLSIAITRMRAELGTPIHDLHFTGPDWMLSELLGTRNISPANLTVFSLFFWFNRAYRYMPMPQQLEGMKLAERTGTSQRRLVGVMVFTGVFGSLAAIWAMLYLAYIYGIEAKIPSIWGAPEAYSRLAGWLQTPKDPNITALGAVFVGLVACLFLEGMRVRFPWWPFHPLAFAVSSSWEINLVWFPLFIAWLLKTVIMRYGGRRGYGRSLPFFFGLMLGQFVLGSLLNIIGIALGIPTYMFWQ
ncbi:MAG: hypothetical protein LC772_07800 [Chloroflexi bacterium]|nr:hypothetical protein [Chloroflexota bacterium]